jgi:hypothetical protein
MRHVGWRVTAEMNGTAIGVLHAISCERQVERAMLIAEVNTP